MTYMFAGAFVLMCIAAIWVARKADKAIRENSKLNGELSDVKSQLRTVEKVRDEWFNEWREQ